ncbi:MULTISPECIES: HU family DNA-binding protein [Eubacteriales]|jgi:DNA-binding protein HU-beta|uniref:HU family DNA-binding protein n=1 Tax=Caproiciproducens faecalis TaxID=2820301 RepID=A0ABS7DQW3_9FIRM|nr:MULTISPECIES: HU family DNA-binding protein [Eubacteriales]MBE6830748.1 HU family DNA-binding protein [Oscillospiraceae bacterium]MBW7573678.1 HU family DNA-binding protein [Caproiciproducens faecalis]MDF1495772.1 HU family DNA-binding protein [Caproiciproducens sp. CPB-2]TQI65818.1 DNA-binding protein HU-beta [Clostridium sp. KNHs216]
MNKTELIAAVAEKAGMSKKDADNAVNAMIDTIVKAVSEDEKVQIVGFGTFEVRSRSERQGRDPRTNSPITIPASKVPAFKAGKAFKDATAK